MTINNVPVTLVDTSALEAELNDLQLQINELATANHEHPISNIDGLATALFDKADKTSVANTVSVLEQQIGGKSSIGHGHQISDVTGLQTALDNKALSTHTHQISDVSNLQTSLNALQLNINGKLSSNYQPIFSSQEPSNPVQGLIWGELDGSNNIIQIWTRLNTSWIVHREHKTFANITTNNDIWIALDKRFNYLFKSLCINILPLSNFDNTNYLDIRLGAWKGNTAVWYDQFNTSSAFFFQSGTTNNVINRLINLNVGFLTDQDCSARIYQNRLGNASGRVSTELKYDLIRK